MDSFEKACRENSGLENFAAAGGENEEADVSLPPHTPLSLLKNNSPSLRGGTCPPPIVPPPSSTPRGGRGEFLGLGFEEVLESAEERGIPEWYADHWFKSMNAQGWKMSNGEQIKNWRALLSSWWMRASEKQKAQIEAAYEAEKKSAAVRAWLAWVSRAKARGKR